MSKADIRFSAARYVCEIAHAFPSPNLTPSLPRCVKAGVKFGEGLEVIGNNGRQFKEMKMEKDYGEGVGERDPEQEINKEGESMLEVGMSKKRGRKPKNQIVEVKIDTEQKKFFVDLSSEEDERRQVLEILQKANSKDYGREILFKDLALFGISKITDKDIPKIQEMSLSKQEKLQRLVDEHNLKHNTALSFEDYFLMKAGIN